MDTLAEIVDALELIRTTDPRRFARIERFTKRIVLANYKNFLGRYRSFGQVCDLKRLPMPESSRHLAIYSYAATLVHESTHARLDSLRFPLTAANRKRIEELCLKEEARFLARFPGISRALDLTLHDLRRLSGRRDRELGAEAKPQPRRGAKGGRDAKNPPSMLVLARHSVGGSRGDRMLIAASAGSLADCFVADLFDRMFGEG
jgi:hypothetical protein